MVEPTARVTEAVYETVAVSRNVPPSASHPTNAENYNAIVHGPYNMCSYIMHKIDVNNACRLCRIC